MVKFRLLAAVRIISACPNCATISDESETAVTIHDIFETQALLFKRK